MAIEVKDDILEQLCPVDESATSAGTTVGLESDDSKTNTSEDDTLDLMCLRLHDFGDAQVTMLLLEDPSGISQISGVAEDLVVVFLRIL